MSLFGATKKEETKVTDYKSLYEGEKVKREGIEKENSDLEHEHSLEIANIKNDHKLALKEKEFELKHFKDEELQKARNAQDAAERKVAVLEKENEMLVKITDLNGDVIDVKKLVSSLIDKLPEVNIKSLSVTASGK